jgi:hypothetical protein
MFSTFRGHTRLAFTDATILTICLATTPIVESVELRRLSTYEHPSWILKRKIVTISET